MASTVLKPWMVTDEKVAAAVSRVVAFCRPAKIVLFGSYVRGRVGVNSDLDMLVVTRDPTPNARKESVRIRRALRAIRMPMDILVVSESRFRALAGAPGLVYREALRTGRTVYEAR